MQIDEAARVFTDAGAYADEPRFHAACALLRRKAPVPLVEVEGFRPFWAVTKHDDVLEIERQPEMWLSAPRPALGLEGSGLGDAEDVPVRTLVQMDAPDHPVYRRISSDWFKPRSITRLADRSAELARRFVDHMDELNGACDFVTDVAMHYPLYVILSLIGLPEDDFPRMLKLTQELFGASDPELRRDDDPDAMMATLLEFFEYFQALVEDRRAHPVDDLASLIANAEIDGEPIGLLEAVGYYVLIATAGHDTTSSAIAGGMHALIQHPDQLDRMLADPSLVTTAIDEMIRWVSPVKQFMRTAAVDAQVRGVSIPAGGSVLLSYPSANRDEEAFERAGTFDVGRDPNRHVGFGFGAHYCLGTHLARMEARALYAELIPRLRSIELAGEPAYMKTLFVGGPKHLPVRYAMR
ncbi:MAG TPA: cytochrome P450 [Acidimicrobiia bacterium]|nr:cytochrome P450 [Acidimicrobiia bacterium]